MDPTITKASTDKEMLVSECSESQSTSRVPNRTRFLAVQAVIRVKQCVKQSFRVSYRPLNLGGVEGGSAKWPPEALRRSRNFFFSYLVAISFPIEFDVWGRLCTHFEAAKVMTFAPVTQHFIVSP
jgi:hypothetical protein